MAHKRMEPVPSSSNSGYSYSVEEKEPLLRSEVTGVQDGDVEFSDKNKKGANEVATFFNFAKASIGSGSFALPWGILKIGVVLGAAGMILLGIASVYTMQLMLDCKRFVVRTVSPEKRKSLNYTELGRIAMGPFGKWAVDISVIVCNLGVCAGYMIFISSNLEWSFSCLMFQSGILSCFTTWEVYAIILPILILLTFLPSFKILAYAAYIGAVFLAVAMVVVYVFGGSHAFCAVDYKLDSVEYLPSSPLGVAQWFGVTAFLFCVHSMVIPLESTMKRPRNMPVILDFAALTVVGINLPFALYGYLLFGSNTDGYVFQNLPGGYFNDVVRIFLSLELTLTFPIVIKPATDVVEEILYNVLMYIASFHPSQVVHELYHSPKLSYKVGRTVMVCALRTVLVLVAWGVAVGIPRFELCLALVGSLATTVLAFVLPPLFHLKLKWNQTHILLNIFHICILIAGILATILATSINLYMAISSPPSGDKCCTILQQCNFTFDTPYKHCIASTGGNDTCNMFQ